MEIKQYRVNQNGIVLGLDDKLVLFPKYVHYLINNNVEVVVQGDRIAERKLTNMMMEWIMKEQKRIPDVALFSLADKAWVYYYVEPDCTLKLSRKGYDYLEYFPSLMDENFNPLYQNMLKNFVKVYSSAKVSVR